MVRFAAHRMGELAEGSVISGKYRIIRRLGAGGMGAVFLANVEGVKGFQKLVAVKVAHGHLTAEGDALERFLDEARLSAQLSHANIGQTFDLGRSGDDFYIAMEFIRGKDLRTLMKEAAKKDLMIPIGLVCFIIERLCEALDYAHALKSRHGEPLKLVHRDVTPTNVIVSYAGEVKLIDFGIASATNRAVQTQAGVVRGKLNYMSPEQTMGSAIDGRSDLFAVGVMFYEMLVGNRPFEDSNNIALMRKVRDCVFRKPREVDATIPAELETIVCRALSKNAEDRYATGADMGEALQRFMMSQQLRVAPRDLAGFLNEIIGPEVIAKEASFLSLPEVSAVSVEPTPEEQPAKELSPASGTRLMETRQRTGPVRIVPDVTIATVPVWGEDEAALPTKRGSGGPPSVVLDAAVTSAVSGKAQGTTDLDLKGVSSPQAPTIRISPDMQAQIEAASTVEERRKSRTLPDKPSVLKTTQLTQGHQPAAPRGRVGAVVTAAVVVVGLGAAGAYFTLGHGAATPVPPSPPPVADTDGDGVPDSQDRCPTVLGMGLDGCAAEAPPAVQAPPKTPATVADSDGDGIPDERDKCPNEAEVVNGVDDDDGCPDVVLQIRGADADRDGIPDKADLCPRQPETFNGVNDDDGCPDLDKGKALVSVGKDTLEVLQPLRFISPASATFDPASRTVVSTLGKLMVLHPEFTTFELSYRPEGEGPEAEQLASARVDAVRTQLITLSGIAAGRLHAAGVDKNARAPKGLVVRVTARDD